ncbi:hypothetical protein CI15_32225 [Paraburkholderia monticola]|uniref:Uncharacterized protein n=1 Tax=Paraburkholderia monticola TaxID=1399968 RepID=A0A149PB43_9BURK|nr:hypothetical protein [Paraburkholderia monticola]KXU82232.1 hypothetical protein CI15_32225 [Paraburkholderia monticola]
MEDRETVLWASTKARYSGVDCPRMACCLPRFAQLPLELNLREKRGGHGLMALMVEGLPDSRVPFHRPDDPLIGKLTFSLSQASVIALRDSGALLCDEFQEINRPGRRDTNGLGEVHVCTKRQGLAFGVEEKPPARVLEVRTVTREFSVSALGRSAAEPVGGAIEDAMRDPTRRNLIDTQGFEGPRRAHFSSWQDDRHVSANTIAVGAFRVERNAVSRAAKDECWGSKQRSNMGQMERRRRVCVVRKVDDRFQDLIPKVISL